MKTKRPMSISKICDEIYKHKGDIARTDFEDVVMALDDARFEWARRVAVEYILDDVEGLIYESGLKGHDTDEYKILERAVKHLKKKLPSVLKEKVWAWR